MREREANSSIDGAVPAAAVMLLARSRASAKPRESADVVNEFISFVGCNRVLRVQSCSIELRPITQARYLHASSAIGSPPAAATQRAGNGRRGRRREFRFDAAN